MLKTFYKKTKTLRLGVRVNENGIMDNSDRCFANSPEGAIECTVQ